MPKGVQKSTNPRQGHDDASKFRPEIVDFKFECTMCKAQLGFTAPSTPGAQMTTQCHSCKGVLTVTIPDTRDLEATYVLGRYVQVLRARQELKRRFAQRRTCARVIWALFENLPETERTNEVQRFLRSWRSFLPIVAYLEKDPAFGIYLNADTINTDTINRAWSLFGHSKEMLAAFALDLTEEANTVGATVSEIMILEAAARVARLHHAPPVERLDPPMMSASPPLNQAIAREQPVPQMARRINEASDALNRQVDTQDEDVRFFTVRCMQCHKVLYSDNRRIPNVDVCVKCHRCANEMTATVPDPRRLAAVNTITGYALVINARKTLHRLRKAAQKRAEAEARAARHAAEQAAAQERRAARVAETRELLRQEMEREAEQQRLVVERAAAAQAAFEAAEAKRLEANRAAHAEFLRRQGEARVAERAAAQAEAEASAPAVVAARQERRDARAADRATRRANKKWVNPIKAEEERRARHSKEVADAEAEAKKVHAEDEAKREAKREAAREAARVAQAEDAARIAEAEARAAARAAERAAEKAATEEAARRHIGAIDLARDRVSASLIHEAIAEVATETVVRAAASPPNKHAHGWAQAAKNVQKTMREVADAGIAAREAEDLDMAIAASLEDTHSSPLAASPLAASPSSTSPPQFKNTPSRKQLRKLNQTPCWYFDRGKCRYGDKCEYMHATSGANPALAPVAPAPVALAPAPAPVAPDEHDVGANTKCIICFEGDKDVVCLPCRHQCACSGCLDVVRRFGTCPICREPIVEAFSVFIA